MNLIFYWYNISMKRFYIQKKGTSTYTETDNNTTSEYFDTEDQSGGGSGKFQRISDSKYKKPSNGSKQENMEIDDIKKKLQGYIKLKTMADKKILTTVPPFKTWVRYINNETKQFRTGGLLMKVNYPDYIMLVNTAKNITWSVQLSDNTIFIQDPKEMENRREKEKQKIEKEETIKDKLYEMYKNGELQSKRK
jgi:hypothetical protein